MQAMYMQYAAAPHHKNQDYGVHRYLGGHKKNCGQGGRAAQLQCNWQGCRGGWVKSDFTHYCWTRRMCARPGTD